MLELQPFRENSFLLLCTHTHTHTQILYIYSIHSTYVSRVPINLNISCKPLCFVTSHLCIPVVSTAEEMLMVAGSTSSVVASLYGSPQIICLHLDPLTCSAFLHPHILSLLFFASKASTLFRLFREAVPLIRSMFFIIQKETHSTFNSSFLLSPNHKS